MSENKVYVDKYQLVIPGDKLATGRFKPGLGVFRERINRNMYDYFSALIGLASARGNVISVIPLEGNYVPLEDDLVIGIITSVGGRSWIVNIRGPYPAILALSNVLDKDFRPSPNLDISKYLSLGDMILAKIISYDRTRDPVLTLNHRGLKKLVSGRLIEIDPVKVPRVIGKAGSMVNLIKGVTRSQLYVGQNGRILINAPNFETEKVIIECIEKICDESHISGLTDRIKLLLEERKEFMKGIEN
ncbi:MAG: exosome complex RNA-binding protein Rrp4 [Candidatus Hodarchaeales archaeon]|jgi:exosome complex component RRP4